MSDATVPVTVLGGGTMGRGIALTVARAGHQVQLVDLDAAVLVAAQGWMADFLEGSVRRGKMAATEAASVLARMRVSTASGDAARSSLVIEALPEDLALKQRVLSQVQQQAEHDVTIHTNTSTLSISDIADGLPAPSLVIGTHYCNPAPVMPLVEVARGARTSEATLAATLGFLAGLGKTSVVLRDRPGLITNYLVVAFENDAVRALEDGLARVEEIDRVVVDGMRFPIGPFRLLDMVGLDVHVAVSESLQEQLGDDQYAVPALVREMVDRGQLGVKTGRGFYDYAEARP